MSVQDRARSPLEGMEQFEYQLIRVRTTYNDDDSGGATGSQRWKFSAVSDQLDRDEVGELVALLPMKNMSWTQDAGSDASMAHIVMSYWHDAHKAKTTDEPFDLNEFPDAYTTNSSTDSLNYRILMETVTHHFFGIDDNASGQGAAQTSAAEGSYYPMLYRRWFGNGPIFEQGDAIAVGGDIAVSGPGSTTVNFLTTALAIWDVWEIETENFRQVR